MEASPCAHDEKPIMSQDASPLDLKKNAPASSVCQGLSLSTGKNKPRFVTREEIQQRAEQARLKLIEREMKECTFSPAINSRSAKIIEHSRRYSKTPTREARTNLSLSDHKKISRTCPSKRPVSAWSADAEQDGVMRRMDFAGVSVTSNNNSGGGSRTPLSARDPNLQLRTALRSTPSGQTPKSKVRHSIAFLAEDRQVCVTIVDGEGGLQTSNVARDRPIRLSLGDSLSKWSDSNRNSRDVRQTAQQSCVWTLDENGRHVPVPNNNRDRVWAELPRPAQQNRPQGNSASPQGQYPQISSLQTAPPQRGPSTLALGRTSEGDASSSAGTQINANDSTESAEPQSVQNRDSVHEVGTCDVSMPTLLTTEGDDISAREAQAQETPQTLSLEGDSHGVSGGEAQERNEMQEKSVCVPVLRASAPVPPPRMHRSRLVFEDLSDESSIGVLRQFVDQEGLDVRASSKRALYVKICEVVKGTDSSKAEGESQDEASTSDEANMLDELLASSQTFCEGMQTRLEPARRVADLWRCRDLCGAVREASRDGDATVLSSLLDCSPSQLLDLDVFAALLHPTAVSRLLQSNEEHHQLSAIHMMHKLLQHFAHVLCDTPADSPTGLKRSHSLGVNVALEERQERCDALCEGLMRIEADMQAIRRRRGRTGPLASACCTQINAVLESRGYRAANE